MSKKNLSRSGRKREEIRAAAYQCLREQGYTATSVDNICKRAGISKGSFYWHYPSKQDVLADIVERWTRQVMDELYEQFEDAVLDDEDSAAATTEALQREIPRGRAVVPLWLELMALGRREPEIQQALAKFYRRARSAVAEILRPELQATCSDEEIRGVAAVAFGGYLGVMLQELSDPDRFDASAAVGHFMAALKGFLATHPPSVTAGLRASTGA